MALLLPFLEFQSAKLLVNTFSSRNVQVRMMGSCEMLVLLQAH
jgi:hypothetical protein